MIIIIVVLSCIMFWLKEVRYFGKCTFLLRKRIPVSYSFKSNLCFWTLVAYRLVFPLIKHTWFGAIHISANGVALFYWSTGLHWKGQRRRWLIAGKRGGKQYCINHICSSSVIHTMCFGNRAPLRFIAILKLKFYIYLGMKRHIQ